MSQFRWTIPNALSVFRIGCAPLLVATPLMHHETAFVVLFVLAQISDILDGFLARLLKQESALGVLLDSYGDLGSYIGAFTGLVIFQPALFRAPYAVWILLFGGLYLLNLLLSFLRYGRLPGLHLYSSKATGYLQGGFLVLLFAWGMVPAFFYVMILAGIFSITECLTINILSPKPLPNAKGLFWVLKEGRWR